MKKKQKIAILCITSVVIIGVGIYVFKTNSMKNEMQMASEFMMFEEPFFEMANKSEIKQFVSATGKVELEDEKPVYTSAEGETKLRVKEVLVAEGDLVIEGQTLLIYDVEEAKKALDKQLRDSEINLENQRLSLRSMALPPSEATIDSLKSAVSSAKESIESAKESILSSQNTIETSKAQIESKIKDLELAKEEEEKAENDISSNKQLLDIGAITREAYEEFVDAKKTKELKTESTENDLAELKRQEEKNLQNLESSKRSLESAERKLESAEKELTTKQKVLSTEEEQINYKKQQNQISLSTNDLQELREKLANLIDDTKSPLSGVVTKVSVSMGSTPDFSTEMFKIADFSKLIIKADISEYDAPMIATGQKVEMTTEGIPDIVYKGKITKIGNSASSRDAVAGKETIVPIEISVENVDEHIKPGFNMECEIVVVDLPEVTNVSKSAVLSDIDEKYLIKVLDDDTIKKVKVDVGSSSDNLIQIISGISPGERVVTNPSEQMSDGMTIEEAKSFGGEFPGQNIPEESSSNKGRGMGRGMRVF